jgi:hypothetical protein
VPDTRAITNAGVGTAFTSDVLVANLEAHGADPKLTAGWPYTVAHAIVSSAVVGGVDLVDACVQVRPGEYRKRVGVLGLRSCGRRRWQSVPQRRG